MSETSHRRPNHMPDLSSEGEAWTGSSRGWLPPLEVRVSATSRQERRRAFGAGGYCFHQRRGPDEFSYRLSRNSPTSNLSVRSTFSGFYFFTNSDSKGISLRFLHCHREVINSNGTTTTTRSAPTNKCCQILECRYLPCSQKSGLPSRRKNKNQIPEKATTSV